MVEVTNPHIEYVRTAVNSLIPTISRTTETTMEITRGKRKFFFKLAVEDFLHDIKGPIPISNISTSPIGTLTLLKYGGPTRILSPVSASVKIGNIVPKNTANAAPRNKRLLKINALSLEIMESNFSSLSSSFILKLKIENEKIKINAIKARNNGPMSDWANE